MQLLSTIARRLRRVGRVAHILYIQRFRGFDPPDEPHFDEQTLSRFLSELARAALYLEYGSGGSTIAADRAGVSTLTVESDHYYARAVAKALSRNSTVRMLIPRLGLTEQWGMPVFRARGKGAAYVQAPFQNLESEFPDLILVDGRYRVACALEVARRASGAGCEATLIFDDYVGRSHYRSVEPHLGIPELVGRAAVFRVGRQNIPKDVVTIFESDPR